MINLINILLGLAVIVAIIFAFLQLTSKWFVLLGLLGFIFQSIGVFFKGSVFKKIRSIGLYVTILGLLLSFMQTLINDKYRENAKQIVQVVNNLYCFYHNNEKDHESKLFSGEDELDQRIRNDELAQIIDQLPRPEFLRNKVYKQRYITEKNLGKKGESNKFKDENAFDTNINDTQPSSFRKQFFGRIPNEKENRYNREGEKSIKSLNPVYKEFDGVKIFAYVNEERTIFVSFKDAYQINKNWVLKRAGDLKIEKVLSKPYGGGIKIVKILSHKELWNFLDIREGDIICKVNNFTIEDITFDPIYISILSIASNLYNKKLPQFRVELYRDENRISKVFIEK